MTTFVSESRQVRKYKFILIKNKNEKLTRGSLPASKSRSNKIHVVNNISSIYKQQNS
jgi:hypothetical protein